MKKKGLRNKKYRKEKQNISIANRIEIGYTRA